MWTNCRYEKSWGYYCRSIMNMFEEEEGWAYAQVVKENHVLRNRSQ
jgi:hypothetical protein